MYQVLHLDSFCSASTDFKEIHKILYVKENFSLVSGFLWNFVNSYPL